MRIKKIKEFTKRKNVLIFSGSARDKNNCPGQDSKTLQMIKKLNFPDFDFEIIDLSIKKEEPIIQPCKGCISTAGGAHCHWFCDCYKKDDKETPDLMYEKNIYEKLEKCDAFIVITPINWWSVPTQVKALFDRLTCASLTITTEQAKEIFGKDNTKDPELTKPFSETEEFRNMAKNHLEGKVAAFFIHGDDGADDYVDRKIPKSYKQYDQGIWEEPKSAIMPLVWQCRYMGIDVPEELIESFYMNEGISYSEANDKYEDGELDKISKRMNEFVKKIYNYIK